MLSKLSANSRNGIRFSSLQYEHTATPANSSTDNEGKWNSSARVLFRRRSPKLSNFSSMSRVSTSNGKDFYAIHTNRFSTRVVRNRIATAKKTMRRLQTANTANIAICVYLCHLYGFCRKSSLFVVEIRIESEPINFQTLVCAICMICCGKPPFYATKIEKATYPKRLALLLWTLHHFLKCYCTIGNKVILC